VGTSKYIYWFDGALVQAHYMVDSFTLKVTFAGKLSCLFLDLCGS